MHKQFSEDNPVFKPPPIESIEIEHPEEPEILHPVETDLSQWRHPIEADVTEEMP